MMDIVKCILNVFMVYWMRMSEIRSGWSFVSEMIIFINCFFFFMGFVSNDIILLFFFLVFKVCEKLIDILLSKFLLKDIKMILLCF